MRKNINGFTIVELLIVIVVIAILAAISIVAYNGIQKRAHNSDQVSTHANIEKLMELYKIENGTYPATNPADGGYCIGTNYPNNYCRDSFSSLRYPESNTTFTDALKTVGSLSNNEKRLVHGTSGPYVIVTNSNGFQLFAAMYGESCPSDYPTTWYDSNSDRMVCGKYYSYN